MDGGKLGPKWKTKEYRNNLDQHRLYRRQVLRGLMILSKWSIRKDIAIGTTYADSLELESILSMPHPPGQMFKGSPPSSRGGKATGNGESRRVTAFMAGSSLGKDENLAGRSLDKDHHGLAVRTLEDEARVQPSYGRRQESVQQFAHEGHIELTYSSLTSSGRDELSNDYQPRPKTKELADSHEFVSSAVLIKCPTGEPDSAKLFYDTMSEDNIASQDFVDKYGFQQRPILLDDMKVYDTPSGVPFAPRFYVEIELKDTVRGIKDYTKASFNVAGSMGGVGLLAGRKFMLEHGIGLSAKEGPGAFVLTTRKPSEGEQNHI